MTNLTDRIAALPPMPQELMSRIGLAVGYEAVLARNALLCEALRELTSYTEACEGLLNATNAGQVINARAILAACEVKL
jgi:hypothetical protein